MKKQKNLFKLADMILGIVCELKKQHLLDVHDKLKEFDKNCDQTKKDSRI